MVNTPTVNPVVFAYNFPHKKTQDFIQRLVVLGFTPRAVLAADPVKLNLPPAAMRIKPRHCDLLHPRDICTRFRIPYHVVDHRSDRCVKILDDLQPKIGLVSGARILPRKIIDCFGKGIVNFHPGLIPEVRGLDALQWAIYHELPIGVTAHLIDHRVDAGRIVERKVIDEYGDDTFIDLSLRLYETQISMIKTTMQKVATTESGDLEEVVGGDYRRSFSAELVPVLREKLKTRFAKLRNSD